MKKKFILPFLLPIQFLLLKLISCFPELVESYYSNGIYGWISKTNRTVFGFFSFSIGDICYGIVLFLVIRWSYKQRTYWKSNWKSSALIALHFLSVFYFLFHFLWALNYYRVPLHKKLKIEKEYSDADLLLFTKKLIAKTNEIHAKIEIDSTKKIIFPYQQQQVFILNLNGYKSLTDEFPTINYSNLSIKKSLISLPLSYMGFGGYLNPFTNEAQVNDRGPMYQFPTVACHEMAHQLGYASESEANFIGFLASIKNENLYFQYSGYSYALRYCLHNWKIRDEKTLRLLLKTVRPGIIKNYDESEQFWKNYETFIEKGFKIFYDTFLKINQQKDGLESYSKFVNLMVNYYKTKPL
jgi:hypothetical protein